MKAFLKYHLYDRFVLAKVYLQLQIWKKHQPILVHTMAKVGSLSVYTSLKKALPKTAIFHTHSLNVNTAQEEVRYCFDNGIYPGSRSPVFLIQEKIISKQKDYKMISLFRDPIERNISAFFDAFELYVGVKPKDYKGDLGQLETLFHKHLPYTYPLRWFDDIFFNDTKINVYDYEFNAELGHAVIKHNGIDVLIMNCYLDDGLKERLTGDFCNLKSFSLTNTNITAHKASRDLYKAFKDFIKFDEAYLEEYYSSKYAKHFFTETQRKKAIEKWLKSK